MVDEDFVMGYAVGYNDGVSSGGGGSGGLDDMTFIKKYQLVGTDWSIGLNADYYTAEESLSIYSTGGAGAPPVPLNESYIAPYPLETNCEIIFVVLKNNKIVGVVPIDKYTRYYKAMSRTSGGAWTVVSEYENKIEDCRLSLDDVSSGSKELNYSWNEVRYQAGVKRSTSSNKYRMVTKYFANGVCNSVSPYIYSNVCFGHSMMSADILKGFLLAFSSCEGIEEIV